MKPSLIPRKQSLHPNEDARKVIQEIHGKRNSISSLNNINNYMHSNWKFVLCVAIVSLILVVGIPQAISQQKNIAIPLPSKYQYPVQEKIIGSWRNVDGSDTIEFFDDGTISYSSSKDKISGVAGDYKFLNNEYVRIKLTYLISIDKVERIIFQNDGKFVLIEQDGTTQATYEKRKT